MKSIISSLALVAVLSGLLAAADYTPDIKSASDEGQRAIQGFKVPDGMKVELFAAEPLLANPVAFCIDEQGRIYVCETFRQQKGVEDNRGHMNWLEDDLSLQTVEERVEMFRKFLGDNVVDYAKEDDRIRLLTDTDGDGKADEATIFAEGFNNIEDGTGAGVLAIDGDVYYTCIPKLWHLRDDDGDGKAEVREGFHHGYGVRVAFRGHDMHGLVLGPDGRIYFSIGDRGYNVLTKEGKHLVRPDAGAVFRCERDGSDLEVFAYGLRNPQELAFDDFGNLFTGDNNSDSGDQARWVQVVQGGDTGWRMYFQYLNDRGPWNRENIWHPYHENDETTRVQPANIIPPIINLADGPSGLVYYPGLGLSERYNGHFFLADFRGGAANSGIRSFAMQPKGATFEITDSHWFIQSILATDVDFGYDGKMYISDWVDGWNGPGKGRIYSFAMPETKEAEGVAKLFKEGFKQRSSNELVELLGHADRRVRQRAQFALVGRNDEGVLNLIAESTEADLLPRIHAIWGLGQLLRQAPSRLDNPPTPSHELHLSNLRSVVKLLSDENPEIRTQAAIVLGNDARLRNFQGEAVSGLINLVRTGTPREQYAAGITLSRIPSPKAVAALIGLLEQNADKDPVARHAAVMGLASCADGDTLLKNASHPSNAVRLGLVLALRRQQDARVALFLNDGVNPIVEEAARAIHDDHLDEALPQLAALADLPGMSDILQRRVMNAANQIGGSENAARIARMAANSELAEHLRIEAIQELLNWDAPPRLDRVTNEFHPIGNRSLDEGRAAVQQSLGAMLSGSDKLRESAIKLAAKYGIRDIGPELVRLFNDKELPASVRVEALSALGSLKDEQLPKLVQASLKDAAPEVRSTARDLLADINPVAAIRELEKALNSNSTPREQQAAIAVLARLARPEADEVLQKSFHTYLTGEAIPEIGLDLEVAAQQRGTDKLAAALEMLKGRQDPEKPLTSYFECLAGGNAERGREIFFGNAAASCRRCHKVNGSGGEVGPDLSGVAKENPREHLLESIVDPNAKIAKGFETITFAMDDGRVLAGIVRSESETEFRIVTPTGETIVIPKDQVEETAKGKSGMPVDLFKQLSKSDIRDLVEFLSTLKTPAPPGGHEG
ncbi:MAG: HEAT repeat domain-containing protein [Planctomycetaceae bacterium]|nr:HEAT repeat domain-containing protein [Planctomycetaceae bacterium]